jgi:hypothetical protein
MNADTADAPPIAAGERGRSENVIRLRTLSLP